MQAGLRGAVKDQVQVQRLTFDVRGVHGDVEEVEFFREGEIFGNQTPAGVYAIFFGEQGFVIGKTDDGGQRRLGSGKAARRAT
ncbi:hypothetical protein ALQ16_205106 [Pseudomonas syringae pv. actinidiae]|nr:hypothetical protein ALQ16_205106 [Pseudomonas syringae pv. actinidiae]